MADPTFDGANKRIVLNTGETTLDVVALYSAWKRWVQLSDNAKWLEAFAPVGGDDIDAGAGTSVPLYAFLRNGWRVKPQEANHTLNVSGGVLLVEGGGDPFVNTAGAFVVRINYQQPVQAITVATGGVDPNAVADAILDRANAIEAGLTPRQAMRLIVAALAGELSGAETTTIVIRNAVADSKNRITAVVDTSGNRSAITYDLD